MYCENSNGIRENRGSFSGKKCLVLGGEKREMVKGKTIEALKSHSEAERRRRERINAHLASLRALVPNNEKMDKAALLAEVINEVKQLKTKATQAGEGLHIPMDTNEVKVELVESNVIDGSFLLRASLCCEYLSDLLPDVRQAVGNLPVQVLKSEISTLGSRVKIVFLITTMEGDIGNAVHVALSNVVDKVSASVEYAQQLLVPNKRQRVSCFDSSFSSSFDF